jgi:hypothetical protein
MPVSLPTEGGDDHFGVHTAHLEFGWGLVEVLKRSVRNVHRSEAVELTIPVGAVIAPGGKAGFSAGMTARFLVPI